MMSSLICCIFSTPVPALKPLPKPWFLTSHVPSRHTYCIISNMFLKVNINEVQISE